MLNILYQYVAYFVNKYWNNPNYVPHPIHRNKYFVTYEFEGKPYNILVSKKRGPAKITSIYGNKEYEDSENVYDEIKNILDRIMIFMVSSTHQNVLDIIP